MNIFYFNVLVSSSKLFEDITRKVGSLRAPNSRRTYDFREKLV